MAFLLGLSSLEGRDDEEETPSTFSSVSSLESDSEDEMNFLLGKKANNVGAGFKITGSYVLDGYDENLERWLDSMGVNGAKMGPVFRKTRVKIMVKEPSKYNKKWNWAHREEGDVSQERSVSYTFEPGKPFVYDVDSSANDDDDDEDEKEGKQEILCTSQASNVILCKTEVPKKEWEVETKVMFTPEGITAVVTNKKENVSMGIKYKRMIDPWATKKKKMLLLKKK